MFDKLFWFVSIAYKWNLKQEENLHIDLFHLFVYYLYKCRKNQQNKDNAEDLKYIMLKWKL